MPGTDGIPGRPGKDALPGQKGASIKGMLNRFYNVLNDSLKI